MTNSNIVTHVTITEENQKLIEAIKASNFMLIDDHGYDRGSKQVDGIAIYTNVSLNTQHVVPMYRNNAFYPYYTMNEIVLDEEGQPHVTRNALTTMSKTSQYLDSDIQAWRRGWNWEMIEAKPFMHPGHLTNMIERI